MQYLAAELLETILLYDELNELDIVNFMLVSQRCYAVGKSDRVWKRKFQARFPLLIKELPIEAYPQGDEVEPDNVGAQAVGPCGDSWYELFKIRVLCGKSVRKELNFLSGPWYFKPEPGVEEMANFAGLLMRHPVGVLLILDELHLIIESDRDRKLTQKYYAAKALKFIKHYQLQQPIENLLQPPAQPLENGAYHISQWCQIKKDFREDRFFERLDEEAWLVLEYLKNRSPSNPANKLVSLHTELLTESLWSPSDSEEVIRACQQVLLTDERLKLIEGRVGLECVYIDRVLDSKKGALFPLVIIIHAVLSRLGVVTQLVQYYKHELLQFTRHPLKSERERYLYVDLKHNRLIDRTEFPELFHHYAGEAPGNEDGTPSLVTFKDMMLQIIMRLYVIDHHEKMSAYLLELYHLLKPDDAEVTEQLRRMSEAYGINLNMRLSAFRYLVTNGLASQRTTGTASKEEAKKQFDDLLKVKRRSDQSHRKVQFSVGMIMKHRRYDYYCVIEGWTDTCEASLAWIRQMGVHRLPNKGNQPFYRVLVDDNSNRYAAQESLEVPESTRRIEHDELGHYFESFEGQWYKPNKCKMLEYPEDYEYTVAQGQVHIGQGQNEQH